MSKRPTELTQPTEINEDRLERHRRKCQICHHPLREEIEEEFVNWHPVYRLAKNYDLADHRSLYRHATATGLIYTRRANMRWALDSILEQAPGHVNADSVVRAIRAYSCIDENNKWSEPPTQGIFSVADRQIPSSGRSGIKHAVRACPEPAAPSLEILTHQSDDASLPDEQREEPIDQIAQEELQVEAEPAPTDQSQATNQDASASLETEQIESIARHDGEGQRSGSDDEPYENEVSPTVQINYVGNIPFADSNRFAWKKR